MSDMFPYLIWVGGSIPFVKLASRILALDSNWICSLPWKNKLIHLATAALGGLLVNQELFNLVNKQFENLNEQYQQWKKKRKERKKEKEKKYVPAA